MEKYSWKAMPCNAMVTGRVNSVLEAADSVAPRALFTVSSSTTIARGRRELRRKTSWEVMTWRTRSMTSREG